MPLLLLVTLEEAQVNHLVFKLSEVIRQTGLSRSTIYLYMSRGDFPKPIRIGTRAVGWLEKDIQDWITARIEASDR